jgi:hypothetical protein
VDSVTPVQSPGLDRSACPRSAGDVLVASPRPGEVPTFDVPSGLMQSRSRGTPVVLHRTERLCSSDESEVLGGQHVTGKPLAVNGAAFELEPPLWNGQFG